MPDPLPENTSYTFARIKKPLPTGKGFPFDEGDDCLHNPVGGDAHIGLYVQCEGIIFSEKQKEMTLD